jgi:hypothetical protein
LREQLSILLFDHVRRELPNLKHDLDRALDDTSSQLELLGIQRSTVQHCRDFLTQLSLQVMEVTNAAVQGHYEGSFFQMNVDNVFSAKSPASIRRLRAVVQLLNQRFADIMRNDGPKYFIAKHVDEDEDDDDV